MKQSNNQTIKIILSLYKELNINDYSNYSWYIIIYQYIIYSYSDL